MESAEVRSVDAGGEPGHAESGSQGAERRTIGSSLLRFGRWCLETMAVGHDPAFLCVPGVSEALAQTAPGARTRPEVEPDRTGKTGATCAPAFDVQRAALRSCEIFIPISSAPGPYLSGEPTDSSPNAHR